MRIIDRVKPTVIAYILPAIVVIIIQAVVYIVFLGVTFGCESTTTGICEHSYIFSLFFIATILFAIPLLGASIVFRTSKRWKTALLFFLAITALEILFFLLLFLETGSRFKDIAY